MTGERRRRSRIAAGLAAVAIVLLGLSTRSLPGELGDLAGGALYTALIYCAVTLLVPTVRPVHAGVVAFLLSSLVELAQLTTLPSVLAAEFPPAALVLGTTFVPLDFIGYAIGALAAITFDAAVARGATRRRGPLDP